MTLPRHTPGRRAGFTLVELLVAMTVIIVLATIALAVVPGALDQDRTTDAAATIRQHLMIAKARATRENNGRGVRFIVSLDAVNPAKTDPRWSTEMQYIEAAPTIIPNPFGLTRPTTPLLLGDPFVEFDLSNAAAPTCTMFNIPTGHEVIQVIDNDLKANWFPTLYCPVLGPDAFGRTQRFEINGISPNPSTAPPTTTTWTLSLVTYPRTLMGAGSTERVYRFAVEPRSRPILGEPNITLPKNVCVDLAASFPGVPATTLPNGTVVFRDFEVMFAPNGQVIDPISTGQIFLWVRDYTKFSGNPAAPVAPGPPPVFDMTGYQQGGEQQLVAIKSKTGALGVFGVAWPDVIVGTTGTYSIGDPYLFARREANSP